jgi:hypothetical protein
VEPILLVHGYGAEARTPTTRDGAARIYGRLPAWLRRTYGPSRVFELNLGRYVSLDDGIGLDDLSRALDHALRHHPADLLSSPFHVVIHSTGSLVVRNWLRRFAGANQPLRNLVHLAGANLGSGWAHLGRGQLARWGRQIWSGSDAGTRILEALELGASPTLDLHLHFLDPATTMSGHYGVREYVVAGSQADASWFIAPVRYAKEDGSDGVIRAAAANLNLTHLRYEATASARRLTTEDVVRLRERARLPEDAEHYHLAASSRPGRDGREVVPFAITYNTAPTGGQLGIVDGARNRVQVEPLLEEALGTVNVTQWRTRVASFAAVTETSRGMAAGGRIGGLFGAKNWSRQAQYDGHCQLIVRLSDQDGRPVPALDVFFGRVPGADRATDVSDLIQHTHRNRVSPNVLTFYLRVERWDADTRTWRNRLADVDGLVLEVSADDPRTGEVQYVPFRHEFTGTELRDLLVPHTSTVVDIEMVRVPSADVFRIFRH